MPRALKRASKYGSKQRALSLPNASNRSQLSNGRAFNPALVDGRSFWARRFRDLLYLHLNDLGGEDACSEAEKAIVRRCCTLIVTLEQMEHKFAAEGDTAVPSTDALNTYQRLTNTLRRSLESLGLKRRAKDITPSLEQYARQVSREAEDAEANDAT